MAPRRAAVFVTPETPRRQPTPDLPAATWTASRCALTHGYLRWRSDSEARPLGPSAAFIARSTAPVGPTGRCASNRRAAPNVRQASRRT